jgi:hypothetical protein
MAPRPESLVQWCSRRSSCSPSSGSGSSHQDRYANVKDHRWPRRNRAPSPTSGTIQMELDLRTYKATDSAARVPELMLTRKRLHATILLPDGSEPGQYELQLEDSRQHPWASARSRVKIRDSIATLRTSLDLSSLASGEYQLAIPLMSETGASTGRNSSD